MHKLHNDLLEKSLSGFPDVYDENGSIIISDTALRDFLSPNVKELTRKYKEICGYEVCILMNCFQNSSNEY